MLVRRYYELNKGSALTLKAERERNLTEGMAGTNNIRALMEYAARNDEIEELIETNGEDATIKYRKE